MKVKSILGIAVCLAAVMLTSCGNGAGSVAGKNSLFGEIPGIYEKRQVEIAKKMKTATESKDEKAILAIVADMQTAFEEAKQEAQPLAEEMVGKVLPYAIQEELPYRIVSDIRVEKVLLPQIGLMGSDKGTRLRVKFDAVITGEVKNFFRLYYLMMSDDGIAGAGCTSVLSNKAVGDTLHMEETVYAPEVPAKYLGNCNLLKFIGEEMYSSEQKSIREKHKQWNDEMKAELGILDKK